MFVHSVLEISIEYNHSYKSRNLWCLLSLIKKSFIENINNFRNALNHGIKTLGGGNVNSEGCVEGRVNARENYLNFPALRRKNIME